MKKIKYKAVFNKYNKTISYRLSECAYWVYKILRPRLTKIIPLSSTEEVHFTEDCIDHFSSTDDMPNGFNYQSFTLEKGFIDPIYIDLFDFLPKEELPEFKKRLCDSSEKMGFLYSLDIELRKICKD